MNDKYSVGRPKLADDNLKKDSLLTCFLAVMTAIMVSIVGVGVLTGVNISGVFNISNLAGNISSSSDCIIKTYKIDKTSTKIIMTCNSNVKEAYLDGTKLTYQNNKLMHYKIVSLDTNKKINYEYKKKSLDKMIRKTYVLNSK